MVMGIITVFIYLLSFSIYIVAIAVLFKPFWYYAIGIFTIATIIYVIAETMTYVQTKKMLKKHKDILVLLDINKAKEKIEEKTSIIEFEKNGDTWTCKKDDKLQLNLKGYMLQKSFILAWITRNVRYKIISNKMRMDKIFAIKLKTPHIKKLTVRFIEKNKCKEYIIVENFISKNNYLSYFVSKSRYYYKFLLSNDAYKSLKEKRPLNEWIYLNFRQ